MKRHDPVHPSAGFGLGNGGTQGHEIPRSDGDDAPLVALTPRPALIQASKVLQQGYLRRARAWRRSESQSSQGTPHLTPYLKLTIQSCPAIAVAATTKPSNHIRAVRTDRALPRIILSYRVPSDIVCTLPA